MKASPIYPSLLLLGIASAAALADPTPPQTARQLVPQLRSLTYPAGDAQVNGLVNAYAAMGEELMEQLERDPLTADQQSYGYYLLGALRVRESAWLLVERIDFKAKSFDSKISLGRWTSHPATEALIKLGRSADGESWPRPSGPRARADSSKWRSCCELTTANDRPSTRCNQPLGARKPTRPGPISASCTHRWKPCQISEVDLQP